MPGIGHRQGDSGDASRGGDRFLDDYPTAGLHDGGHTAQHHGGIVDVEEQEPAERQIDLLGEDQVLPRLGERDDLGVGGRSAGHFVAGLGIAVHRVDPALASHHFGQGDRDVAAAGSHVEAAPARPEAEALQGRGQRPPVDVVAKTRELTHDRTPDRGGIRS